MCASTRARRLITFRRCPRCVYIPDSVILCHEDFIQTHDAVQREANKHVFYKGKGKTERKKIADNMREAALALLRARNRGDDSEISDVEAPPPPPMAEGRRAKRGAAARGEQARRQGVEKEKKCAAATQKQRRVAVSVYDF